MVAIAQTRAITGPLRPFTAAEYEHMVMSGILCEDERVELLEGTITQMACVNDRMRSPCWASAVVRL